MMLLLLLLLLCLLFFFGPCLASGDSNHIKFALCELNPRPPPCKTVLFDQILAALSKHPFRAADDEDEVDFVIPMIDTTLELNWPKYGHADLSDATNMVQGLPSCMSNRETLIKLAAKECCRRHRDNPMVIFDMMPVSLLPTVDFGVPIVWVSHSWHEDDYRNGWDVSFAPMPIVTTATTTANKKRRKYLLSFRGRPTHPIRSKLMRLNKEGPEVHIVVGSTEEINSDPISYEDLLLQSVFVLVVRGDMMFSYRLLEVLSAGSIPVILSDGWVLPFSEDLDWSEFSLSFKENSYLSIVPTLRSIPEEKIASMRKRGQEVYDRYFRSVGHQVDFTLQLFDRRMQRAKHCSATGECFVNVPRYYRQHLPVCAERLCQHAMGIVETNRGQLSDAQKKEVMHFFQIATNTSKDARCHTIFGAIKAMDGNLKEAEVHMVKATQYDDNDVMVWTNYGALMLSKKQYATAAEAFRYAIIADPNNSEQARMQLIQLTQKH